MSLEISEHCAKGMKIQDISNCGGLISEGSSGTCSQSVTTQPVGREKELEGYKKENSWVEMKTF